MPHPEINNELLGFGYESLLTTDLSGAPIFVPLVQATYAIDADGSLDLLKQQVPPMLAGQSFGDPETSSIKFEPQIAFRKLATDVVLHGFAYPETPGANRGLVGVRVGNMQKLVHVFGDRQIYTASGTTGITQPQVFDRIPLVYERCFGGWDRRHKDPNLHRAEPRNPVGVGYYDTSLAAEDGLLVPNFEDPNRHYQGYGDAPPPAGFGFISANWQPRVALAGSYNEIWDSTRKPLLPDDFDIRFFNAASAGLVAAGHLQGDEEVVVIGATPEGRMAFRLPGVTPPVCTAELRLRKRVAVGTALDTVIVDADARTVSLLWRGQLVLMGGVHDLLSVDVGYDAHARQRAAEDEDAQ